MSEIFTLGDLKKELEKAVKSGELWNEDPPQHNGQDHLEKFTLRIHSTAANTAWVEWSAGDVLSYLKEEV